MRVLQENTHTEDILKLKLSKSKQLYREKTGGRMKIKENK